MSQQTSQIGASKTGLDYRTEDNAGKQALLNHHKGPNAPSYAEAGIIWLDDTATPWIFKMHDGTDWITIGTVNAANNKFTPFINGAALTTASTSVVGIVEKATQTEVNTGTDGDRYVTPKTLASATSISSGGLVLLATATASASASIDFTSSIDGTYEEYELHVIDLIPATDNTAVWLRVSNDAGSTFKAGATDYEYATFSNRSGAGTPIGVVSTGVNNIPLSGGLLGVSNVATQSFNSIITIYNPSNSASKPIVSASAVYLNGGGALDIVNTRINGMYTTGALAVDALRILTSSGNIASGEFKLYGVKKS